MTTDAASCAALAADLHTGAASLARTAPAAGADEAEVQRVADAMEELGTALDDFAERVRAGRATRPGMPSPHTALRHAAERATAALSTPPTTT